MKFKIISFGRERSDPTAPLVADYVGRISKFLPISDTVVKADREDKVTARIDKETAGPGIFIALDERGRQHDSFELAGLVDSWMQSGVQEVAFVIGPAEGLPKSVKEKADALWALSKMTLPHRFARLILAEQLYRALCIIRKVPYQK